MGPEKVLRAECDQRRSCSLRFRALEKEAVQDQLVPRHAVILLREGGLLGEDVREEIQRPEDASGAWEGASWGCIRHLGEGLRGHGSGTSAASVEL